MEIQKIRLKSASCDILIRTWLGLMVFWRLVFVGFQMSSRWSLGPLEQLPVSVLLKHFMKFCCSSLNKATQAAI
jgi:Fe2+ transport system protein B